MCKKNLRERIFQSLFNTNPLFFITQRAFARYPFSKGFSFTIILKIAHISSHSTIPFLHGQLLVFVVVMQNINYYPLIVYYPLILSPVQNVLIMSIFIAKIFSPYTAHIFNSN